MKSSAVRPSPLFLGLVVITIAGGALTLVESLAALRAGAIIFVLGGWAISLCIHEFGHAFIAFKGGDYSVREKGYLTLDIRHYTDPVMSILLPLILLLIGGIPLPGGAVWINHYALRSKRVESFVSLAGPASNLLIGILLSLIVLVFSPSEGLAAVISYLALLQILAFILNILPVPGLDGWGIFEPYLSSATQQFGAKARPWAPLILFGLLIAFPPLSALFFRISFEVFSLIGGDRFYAVIGQELFLFWRG